MVVSRLPGSTRAQEPVQSLCRGGTQRVANAFAKARLLSLLVHRGGHALGCLAGRRGERNVELAAPRESFAMGRAEQSGNGARLAGPRSAGDHRDPPAQGSLGGLALKVGCPIVVSRGRARRKARRDPARAG